MISLYINMLTKEWEPSIKVDGRIAFVLAEQIPTGEDPCSHVVHARFGYRAI